jgi:predicted nucleic acid-binding protein
MPAAGAERFTLDTNVLVYAVDTSAGVRHDVARHVVLAAQFLDCRLTLQAVSEFYWAVTRKRIVPADRAALLVHDWLTGFPADTGSAQAVRRAVSGAKDGLASFWDAHLIATAAEAGCTTAITEDMADGTTLFGVRIVNPFGTNGLSGSARALLGNPPE